MMQYTTKFQWDKIIWISLQISDLEFYYTFPLYKWGGSNNLANKTCKIKVKKQYLGKQSHKKFIFKGQGNQIKHKVTALFLFVIKIITTVAVRLDALICFILKHRSFWALQTVQSADKETTVPNSKSLALNSGRTLMEQTIHSHF